MTKPIIYLCGNPLLAFDSLPLRLKPGLTKALPQFNFIEIDPTENLHPINGELTIIDTILDIDNVKIFTDIGQIKNSPQYSLHDLDLGFNLKLLQKIGTLKKVTIYGVPPNLSITVALSQITTLLKKIQD
ncbi:MAG: hypothetical protein WCK11_04800 [Candidatus Falkowbacteria bacterium]